MLIFSASFLITFRKLEKHSSPHFSLLNFPPPFCEMFDLVLAVCQSEPWWFLTGRRRRRRDVMRAVLQAAWEWGQGPGCASPHSPSVRRSSTWARWPTSCARPGPGSCPSSAAQGRAGRSWLTQPRVPGCRVLCSVRPCQGPGTLPGQNSATTTSHPHSRRERCATPLKKSRIIAR